MADLPEQRRALPDEPGVYLFRDTRGKVVYVGKAKSIRKRVASHFSNPTTYGSTSLPKEVDHIEYLVVHTETEALLTEQNFIRQYKPRFNIRLRDDKSYPYIAISLDEDFPRVYFTRERHRRDRAYFGPYSSSAKRTRHTLDLLGKVFNYRSCEGPTPGPPLRLAVPGLLHQALRGALRRLRLQGGVPRVDRRRHGVPVAAATSEIERDLEKRMYFHAGEQDFEQATVERNRLQSIRALLERQRVVDASAGSSSMDAVAVAIDGAEANAQVFQVRDGVLADRQSFYLVNEAGHDVARATEEFLLQYYASALSIPALIVVRPEVADGSALDVLSEILGERRGGRVEIRAAERGAKRRILDLAERNAQLALDQDKLKAERRRQQRVEALDGLQTALGLDSAARAHRVLRHLEPDGHPSASRRWSSSRAARRRSPTTGASGSATSSPGGPTTSPPWTRCCAAAPRSSPSSASCRPTTTTATRASPRCPT